MRQRQLGGCKVAQGLQARGQAEHHHAQVFGESQQHFAHAFGLRCGRLRHGNGCGRAVDRRLGAAGQALHPHQLGGLHSQRGEVVAKRFGDHVLGLVQVVTGIHQITGRLHGLGAANRLQDGCHRIGMGQRAFTRVQQFSGDQRLSERAGAHQSLRLVCQTLDVTGNQRCAGCKAVQLGRVAFHRAGGLAYPKNFKISSSYI